MKNIYHVVARRSLNHVKNINPIMYLALRCFFDSFSKKMQTDNAFMGLIERKLYVRKNWSTHSFKLFKEKNNNDYTYRDMLSLSTLGTVSESYILMKILESTLIENKEYVYSYKLPKKSTSSRNYEYYFNGYKNRNKDITNVLKENSDHVAVILDLRKFYPSIDKEKVKNTFFHSLGQESDNELYNLSKNIVSSTLEKTQGVPIGTSLSHIMADIYLSEFDKSLSEQYPKKYFRYVDDIVIVCIPSEVDDVKEYVKSKLSEELEINEDKTDILTAQEWFELTKEVDTQNENLNDILHYITAYIAMHPDKIEELSKQIQDSGHNIPIRRIEQQAKNRMFRLFLRTFLKKKKKYSSWEIYFTKPNVIVGKLLAQKTFYRGEFNRLVKLKFDNTKSSENRNNTQQLRYVIGRLFYLLTIEELAEIIEHIPDTNNFKDTKEIIHALAFKDLIETIQYGGRVVQTVSELWIGNNFDAIELTSDDFQRINKINDVVDSIIVLYLHKVITFNFTEILDFLDEYNKEYLQVTLDDTYKINDITNEYLLELQGLFADKDLDAKFKLLTTRFDDDEEIQLAGLNLGVGYY